MLPRLFAYVIRKFLYDRCFESASSLTYTTLLSIVPLMAVSFYIAQHLPFFINLWGDTEQFIFDNFVPATGVEIRKYLVEFVYHAGELTFYGSLFLLLSALTLIYTIELTFNRIWGVRADRGIIESFFLYCALLLCAPILMGFSFFISTYIWSLTAEHLKLIGAHYFLKFVPFSLTWGCFTVLYILLPNCRVSKKHALWGALVAAALFEGAKFFFALYVANMNSNTLIYGAFATIPIFLLWIYISWLIVLFGAEVVCAISFYRDHQQSSS